MTLGNTMTFDELMNGNLHQNQIINGPSWRIISESTKTFSAEYVGWSVCPYIYFDLSNTTWKEIQSLFFREREYGVDLPCNLYFRTFFFNF